MKRVATILLAILGMASGAWAQSLLEAAPGVAPGAGPYDPPRSLLFKKHDLIQIVPSAESSAPAFSAEIADIRPNGTIVLRATQMRKANEVEERVTLIGEVAPGAIADRRVGLEKLANVILARERAMR